MALAEKVRDCQDRNAQHHEAEMPRPAGQLELGNGDLRQGMPKASQCRGLPARDSRAGRPRHDGQLRIAGGTTATQLRGEILEPAEGAGPAAEQAAHQGAEYDKQADRHERDQVQGTEVGQDADGAGEGRQRAGVAVKDRGTDAVIAETEYVQPDEQERGLDPEAVRLQPRENACESGSYNHANSKQIRNPKLEIRNKHE